MSLKIRKGDKVKVITGKDKGKVGKVLKTFADDSRVVIEKVNRIKKHTKPSQKNQQGGIVDKEAPINISNIMLVCPKCGAGTRVSYYFIDDSTKVRKCKKCNEIIDEA